MAHGNPKIEICESCNLYGLTHRFSESKCPECGVTKSSSISELFNKLGLLFGVDHLYPSFTWQKISKNELA